MRRILLCSKVFSIFPRFSPTIFYRDAISVLLQILAHFCTAVLIGCTAVDFMCRKPYVRNCSRESKGLYNNGNVILTTHLCTAAAICAENSGFEIVQESVKVCTTGMSSRTLYAQHPVSISPGSRLRFFIAGQIQHRTVHRFFLHFSPS